MKNISLETGYAEFKELQYVSDKPMPKVGDAITVEINGIGKGTVTGFFVEHGFIGLMVKPHNPPEWYLKQNGGNVSGHVFPAETKEL